MVTAVVGSARRRRPCGPRRTYPQCGGPAAGRQVPAVPRRAAGRTGGAGAGDVVDVVVCHVPQVSGTYWARPDARDTHAVGIVEHIEAERSEFAALLESLTAEELAHDS